MSDKQAELPFHNQDTSEWGDVNVRFKNVKFGVNQNYKDAEGGLPVVMILDMENAAGTVREDQLFSIGSGYVAIDGGAAVEHSRAKFNKPGAAFTTNSKAATLLDSLVKIDGALEMLTDRADKTGGPRHAAFWEGMVLHVHEETVEWGKPGEDGKRKTFRQWVASELFGWDVEIPDDDGDDGDEGPTLPPAAKTAADFQLGNEEFETLVGLANQSASYEDFISDAYSLPIIADLAVQAAVDDDIAGIWSLKVS